MAMTGLEIQQYLTQYLTDIVDARGDDQLLDGLYVYEMLHPRSKFAVTDFLLDMHKEGALEAITYIELIGNIDPLFDFSPSEAVVRVLGCMADENAPAPDALANLIMEEFAYRDYEHEKLEAIANYVFELTSLLVIDIGRYA